MVAIVDISNDVLMPEYGRQYRRLSRKYGAILIARILDGIVPSRDLQSDFIHPNSLGYKLIAFRVYRQILPYLNRNAILRRSSR
jgi:lysophospholipase L1-like esterase